LSAAYWLLALVLASVASAGGGVYVGHADGVAETTAKQDAQTVGQLTNLISSHQGLIDTAAQVSRGMRQALAKRQSADAKSTQEFKDGLTPTAGDRAGCLFPADSMRQLAQAHARAAEAAASGIHVALPGANPTADRP
jgi:hypothetical protein